MALESKNFVREHIDTLTVIDGLIEELAELQQALCKVKRAFPFSKNPTPVTMDKAVDMVTEELGDVMMMVDLLQLMNIDTSDNPKWERWAKRLNKVEEEKVDEAEPDA